MHPGCRALVAGALAVALAACAPGGGLGPTTGPTGTTALPGSGGAPGPVVVGLGGFGSPRTLNPLLDGADTGVLDVIGAAVFASAFRVDAGSRELVPEVMLEVPGTANGGVVARPDGTRLVTYRVDPAARWADGEPITAEDLRFTYEVAADPALPIRRDERARYAAVVPGSVSADGLTLQLAIRAGGDPASLFGIILPAHEVAGTDFAGDWNDRMWVGGGAFTFVDWQPGQYLRVRRNAFHEGSYAAPGVGGMLLDKLVYRFFPAADGAALAQAFASRLVDVAVLPAGAGAGAYLGLSGQGARLESAAGTAWLALAFQFGAANPNPASLNGELRFRQAVAAAVDREAVAALLGTAPVASLFAGGDPELGEGAWAAQGADAAEAARLLGQLGHDLGVDLGTGEGPSFRLAIPGGSVGLATAAEGIAGMLHAAGIAAEVRVDDAARFQTEILPEGAWEATLLSLAVGPGLGSAERLVRWFDPDGRPGAGVNLLRWGSAASPAAPDDGAAAYAALLEALGTAAGEQAVRDVLREAERLLADRAVLLPLAWSSLTRVAYWPDGVRGVTADPADGLAGGVAGWWRPG